MKSPNPVLRTGFKANLKSLSPSHPHPDFTPAKARFNSPQATTTTATKSQYPCATIGSCNP